MPYSKMLAKIISESGYTQKQIINKCEEEGRRIDKTYLSKLINGKTNPPKEEVSQLISKICDVDERILIIEGYIDKAPAEIKEIIYLFKLIAYFMSLKILENKFEKNIIKQLDEYLREEPISEFVITILDNKDMLKSVEDIQNNLFVKLDDENNLSVILGKATEIYANDDAMSPLILKGSKIAIRIEEKYVNGDIVQVKIPDFEKPTIRILLYSGNDNITLVALNKKYGTTTYRKEDVKIISKVEKITNDI